MTVISKLNFDFFNIKLFKIYFLFFKDKYSKFSNLSFIYKNGLIIIYG